MTTSKSQATKYLTEKFNDVKNNANAIEARLSNDFNKDEAIAENFKFLFGCQKYNLPFLLIDEFYNIDNVWKNFI